MTTVTLHGELGRLFGPVWRLQVSSLGEALRAIDANVSGKLLSYLAKTGDGLAPYRVLFNGRDSRSREELYLPPEPVRTLDIMPAIAGAGGNAGTWQIIAGIILIALAAILIPGSPTVTLPLLTSGVSGVAFTLGVSLIIGGVSAMLAPSPKSLTSEKPNNQPSYIFNGPVNTYRQGNPVPVGYGLMLIGSQVISAGMSSTDLPMVEKWEASVSYVKGAVVFFEGQYFRSRQGLPDGLANLGKTPTTEPSYWANDTA